MSKRFKQIKAAYDRGSWDKAMVRNAVEMGWITAAEYELITGETYVVEDAGIPFPELLN